MNERLDKIISNRALLSRRDAASAIRGGRVSCGGDVCRDPAAKFDPDGCDIRLNGEKIRKSPFIYIMMNKPEGVLSATEDKEDKTVLDFLPDEYKKRALGVCGRLDKDASGLLLLTDDGQLNHKITSPKSHAEKYYEAHLDSAPPPEAAAAFAEGMDLGDFKAKPAKLETAGSLCFVTISEGKFHQVKRMFQKVGRTVLKLKRLKIASLSLDETLKPGQWRELTEEELAELTDIFR